ncbi:MAG: SRPBCC domain-containing protein [Acidimicrobiales bacterium]|jgi:activator of HSP90 ATPase
MTYDFEVSGVVPADRETLYRAWLSSEEHSAMTGGEAHIDPVVGGEFSAWGDYIHGTTLELEPFDRIVQSWRTQNFADGVADSKIEVRFESVGDATLVRVVHTNVPDGDVGYEQGGWEKSYFKPMAEYFGSRR